MRQWRVGTLSMGLLLVFAGLGLLLSQFNKIAVLDLSLKWWPIIFILLGIEILTLDFFNKGENNRVKYDVFSIFITLLIVLTGLGLQTMAQLGLVAKAQTVISSQIFTIQDTTEITVEPGIKKIILKTSGNQVSLRNSPNSVILAQSDFQVRAQSRIDAQGTAGQYSKISEQRSGDTLYLILQRDQGSDPIICSSYSLVLPENAAVEVEGAGGSLNINLAAIKSDWVISGSGFCSIKVPAGSDLTINSLLNREEALHSNLTWTKSKIGTANNSEADPNSINTEQVQAQSKLGNGSHKINILDVDDLTVNSLL